MDDENLLQHIILFKLFSYLLQDPKIQPQYGDGSLLINLNFIMSKLHEIAPQNPLLTLKSLKLINSMAFKNTMEVRRQMKTLNMF